LIIVLGLSILAWWLFASSTFRVTNVSAKGFSSTLSKDVVKKVTDTMNSSKLLMIHRDSIWLFPSDEVKKKIVESFPGVKDLKITRRPFHQVVIQGREEKGGLLWQTGQSTYLVNEQGIVSQLISQPEKVEPQLIKLRDSAAVPVKIGQHVATTNFVKFVESVGANFNTVTGAHLAELTIPNATLEVQARTGEAFLVYFDPTRDPGTQLEYLRQIIVKAKGQNKALDYVDLRIEGRIFYKTK
jgi:cell division septal protein FtsQ